MPSDYRLWLGHDEAFSPFLPYSGNACPEKPIFRLQSPAWSFAIQNGIVPQNQVFKSQLGSIFESGFDQ